jgi:hypothetical protein
MTETLTPRRRLASAVAVVLGALTAFGAAGCSSETGEAGAPGEDSAEVTTGAPSGAPSTDPAGPTASGGTPPSSVGAPGTPPPPSSSGAGAPSGPSSLAGYWVWEQRVQGTAVQSGPVDKGQMKVAFGTGNNKCHYIWNETTGSDFHTECTFAVVGDLMTLTAKADPDKTAAGYSCAHPDWTSWNDRPAIEYSRFKFVGDRLWMGVNTYWGFGGGVNGVPTNGSLKRFPFWESSSQATTLESWIVFKRVTRAEWFGKYAISTNCQGTPAVCAQWPGCGAGDKPYVD